jgi:putative ABC transport system permease protein
VTPGLVRQALRAHRASFLGPFCTQTLAATIISASQFTLSGLPGTTPAGTTGQVAEIREMATVFLLISVYLSVVVVAATMASAVGRQTRDIALVRAIGATPGQVRRAVGLQAAAIAVPAACLGFVLGVGAGRVWTAALADHGLLPAAVGRATPGALLLVLAAGTGTSLLGGLGAAARPARVRPAAAMSEVSAGRSRIGRPRAVLGTVLVAGGGMLSVVLSTAVPDPTGDTGVLVMLALCIGVGLLGPVLLRSVGRPVTGLLRALGGPERLAAENVPALSLRSGAALVPLVLAVAFAAVKVAARTTAVTVTGTAGPAADVWLDAAGTSVYCGFAAVAAVNALVTVTVSRRRELAVLRVVGATRWQALRVPLAEAAVLVAVTTVLAAAVSLVTLVPLLRATLGVALPAVPGTVLAGGVAGIAVLVLVGTVLPAALLGRRPAVSAVRSP